ncbi:MAG: hypothetical protein EOP86_21735 [Verrucomicrobiaceae bacterium]|nr:MAG: hypothetical protein EOP86_21735 [Verrucomicrobiaceae bacterium]
MSPRAAALLLVSVPSLAARPLEISRVHSTTTNPEILWSVSAGLYTGELAFTKDAVLFGTGNGTTGPFIKEGWTRVLPPRVSFDEYDNALVCLDSKTGELRWRAVHPQVYDRSIGIPSWPITSKPAAEGDRVYYLSVNWELICADLEGFHDGENDGPFTGEKFKEPTDVDIVWRIDFQKDLGVKPSCPGDVGYVQSSPLVMGGLVYVVTGNGADWKEGTRIVKAPDAPSFLAMDRLTGKIAWSSRAPAENIIWLQGASPVALPERGEVVFPGGDGCLYGFDAKTGEQYWKADLNAIGGTKDLYFECRPLVVNGMVIASLRKNVERGPIKNTPLIAVKPGKPGAPVETAWVFGKDLDGFWPQSLAQDGTVYAISAPNLLHALDPATGRERWCLPAESKDIGDEGLQIGGGQGRLYLTNSEAELMIIDPSSSPPAMQNWSSPDCPFPTPVPLSPVTACICLWSRAC